MIWLTWRQSRIQALVAAAALALLAIVYALTGPGLNHLYNVSGGNTTRFLDQVKANGTYPLVYFAGGAVMYLVPAIIGLFWGAPMIAKELEAGTYRLAWSQSVSRRRWLLAKAGIGALAAMAFAGLASLMLTWWASPIDKVGGFPAGSSQLSRFQPIVFGARGIVPIGTAALAFTLGVTLGLLIRRVIPAMAVTLAVFIAAMIAMPMFVAPHLLTPDQYTHPVRINEATMSMTSNGQINDPVTSLPGAWILSDQVITRSGAVFTLPSNTPCSAGSQAQCQAWLGSQPVRQHVTYQPASRYWTFQIYETAIWLAIAAGLGGLCLWRIRRA